MRRTGTHTETNWNPRGGLEPTPGLQCTLGHLSVSHGIIEAAGVFRRVTLSCHLELSKLTELGTSTIVRESGRDSYHPPVLPHFPLRDLLHSPQSSRGRSGAAVCCRNARRRWRETDPYSWQQKRLATQLSAKPQVTFRRLLLKLNIVDVARLNWELWADNLPKRTGEARRKCQMTLSVDLNFCLEQTFRPKWPSFASELPPWSNV